MGDMTTEGASISAGIDLSQFYQVFFEEAGENLDNMEQLLLNVNVEAADDEELNAIFRCAHSIKGGAATFGFSDVANLDEGAMWPTSFALKELTAAEENRIAALVKKAVS